MLTLVVLWITIGSYVQPLETFKSLEECHTEQWRLYDEAKQMEAEGKLKRMPGLICLPAGMYPRSQR